MGTSALDCACSVTEGVLSMEELFLSTDSSETLAGMCSSATYVGAKEWLGWVCLGLKQHRPVEQGRAKWHEHKLATLSRGLSRDLVKPWLSCSHLKYSTLQ